MTTFACSTRFSGNRNEFQGNNLEWYKIRGSGSCSGVVFVNGVFTSQLYYSWINLLEGWKLDTLGHQHNTIDVQVCPVYELFRIK